MPDLVEMFAEVEELDGHGEDDGGVVLGRDGAQRLQVPQLDRQIVS